MEYRNIQSEIDQIREFVKASFVKNPSYSFNNWKIMYEHSVKVKDFALQIASEVECDKEVLQIGALLHDIGKTYQADSSYLREHHDKLGYAVAKDCIAKLNLTGQQVNKLKTILSGKKASIESRIINDADIIAFFADERLHCALDSWAKEQKLPNELQRKANKISSLKYFVSKEIARPFHEAMKRRWHLN